MAKKDGLNIRLEGGAMLDRVLSKMAITHQSAASRAVNQSLTQGATAVKQAIKPKLPEYEKNTTGFINESRNVTKGQLKRSLKSGLRNRVNLPKDVFLGGVWFQEGQGKGKKKDDGFFAKWVFDNPHKDNAFGFSGGRNLGRLVKPASPKFKKIVGVQLAKNIAKQKQKEIDKLK